MVPVRESLPGLVKENEKKEGNLLTTFLPFILRTIILFQLLMSECSKCDSSSEEHTHIVGSC